MPGEDNANGTPAGGGDNNDVQAQIDAAVAEALKPYKDSVAKLETNNAELLGEKKKAAERAAALEQQIADAARKEANGTGDAEVIRKNVEQEYKPKLDAEIERANKLQERLDKLLIDGGLQSALTEAGVAPHFIKPVLLMLKNEHSFAIKDDAALVDGQSIGEFVANWAKGESAKYYLAAPDNGGGNAGTNGKKQADNPWAKGSFNLTEQGRITRENPALADKLKAQAGR